jgi:hypothetical protein
MRNNNNNNNKCADRTSDKLPSLSRTEQTSLTRLRRADGLCEEPRENCESSGISKERRRAQASRAATVTTPPTAAPVKP